MSQKTYSFLKFISEDAEQNNNPFLNGHIKNEIIKVVFRQKYERHCLKSI